MGFTGRLHNYDLTPMILTPMIPMIRLNISGVTLVQNRFCRNEIVVIEKNLLVDNLEMKANKTHKEEPRHDTNCEPFQSTGCYV